MCVPAYIRAQIAERCGEPWTEEDWKREAEFSKNRENWDKFTSLSSFATFEYTPHFWFFRRVEYIIEFFKTDINQISARITRLVGERRSACCVDEESIYLSGWVFNKSLSQMEGDAKAGILEQFVEMRISGATDRTVTLARGNKFWSMAFFKELFSRVFSVFKSIHN